MLIKFDNRKVDNIIGFCSRFFGLSLDIYDFKYIF